MVRNLTPERNMLLIGECDDRTTERIGRLRATLSQALIASPPVTQIREAIWSKLLTNMSMSVLCLLTGQTARAVRDDPDLSDSVFTAARGGEFGRTKLLPQRETRHTQRPRA